MTLVRTRAGGKKEKKKGGGGKVAYVTGGHGPGSVPLMVIPGGHLMGGGPPLMTTGPGIFQRQPWILIRPQSMQICKRVSESAQRTEGMRQREKEGEESITHKKEP